MAKTPQEIIKERYEKCGNIARFADLSVSLVGEKPEPQPGYLDWNGQQRVVGTNDNLAGVLIDEKTVMVIDLADERIVEMDEKVITACTYAFRQTRDPERDAEIMALYQRLVNELLKQYYKVAG